MVGVVVSIYGRYSYVGEAIESVLRQSLRPREVVVVADDPDKVPFRDEVYVVDRGRDRKYGPAILRGVDTTTLWPGRLSSECLKSSGSATCSRRYK